MTNNISIKTKQFEQVFDRNFSAIYNYVYFKTGHHPTAEDITADVFVKAFEHYESYNPEKCGIQTWLRAIAHNAVVDHFRKNSRMVANGQEILRYMPADDDIEAGYIDKELTSQLIALVKQLPELHQELLSLKYFLGMTNREISRVTALSETNVGTILHRVIRKLKKQMEQVQ